jgi:DNA sulfur modification protein DndE
MSIKTSLQNKVYVSRLTSLFKFKSEAVIARIAINHSLQQNKKFSLSDTGKSDNEGKEYKEETLFGSIGESSNRFVYKSMFEQHYGKNFTDNEFAKLVKMHLDDGIDKLAKNLLDVSKGRNHHFDYLLNMMKNGLSLITETNVGITYTPQKTELPSYNGLVKFDIGTNLNGSPLTIEINDLKKFDSHHIAIAGMTGSGKTELMKDVLFQISSNTKNKLHFIFFDYKGEGNSNDLKAFLDATNCEFVDVLNDGFNLNPLEYINMTNENLRLANIKSFVDSVSTIATSIGVKQKHILQTVIKDSVELLKDGSYPTLKKVFNRLVDYYEEIGESPDTLYSTLDDMSSFIFSDNSDVRKASLFDSNIYLNLPQTLSDTLRQLCVFLTLNYILEFFNNSNDTKPDDNKIKPLRYIVVIDEAHVYLKNKNARKKLENLLRIIRSKGVIIIMLTQGVEDFKTKDFDFVSQVKLPICLNVRNKDIKTIKHFLGSSKSELSMKNAIQSLEIGKGLINIDKPEVFTISQFWKRDNVSRS